MKQKIRILSLLLLILVSTVLAFSKGQTEESKGPVTISWMMGSWWNKAAPGVVSKFEETHPNIKIDYLGVPYAGYLDKLISSTMGPNPPDVVSVANPTMLTPLLDRGVIETLEAFVKKSEIIKKENYFETTWEQGVYKGKLYSIPYRINNFAFFYNTGHFKEVGLDPTRPPKTMEEVYELAKKLTVPEKHYGIGMPAASKHPEMFTVSVAIPIWAFGGSLISDDWSEMKINEPKALKGVEWYVRFFHEKLVPVGSMSLSIDDLGRVFGAGTISMFTCGRYGHDNISETATPDLEYEVAPHPGNVSWTNSRGNAIPKNSKHKTEAWTFIEWFSDPNYLPDIEGIPIIPACKSVLTHPKWATPSYDPFWKSAEYARGFPAVASWAEINQILTEETQAAILGKKSVESAMDVVARKGNALLQ